MTGTLFTTLSSQELSELIMTSVKNAIGFPKTSDEEDTLLDCKEAALLIKYEVTSIYGLVKRNKIPHSKVEGKLLFSKKKLLKWVEENSNKLPQKK